MCSQASARAGSGAHRPSGWLDWPADRKPDNPTKENDHAPFPTRLDE